MTTFSETTVRITRVTVTSERPYDEVLTAIQDGLGHVDDLEKLIATTVAAQDRDEFDATFYSAAGSSGLIEFMTLDLGAALTLRVPDHARRMTRIIAGNPVTMTTMAATVPDVGSYAPISILVVERAEGVTLSYDRLASAIASHGDPDADAAARAVDTAVVELLTHAAG